MPLKALLFNGAATKWESRRMLANAKIYIFFISMFATRSASRDIYCWICTWHTRMQGKGLIIIHRTKFPFPFSGGALQKKAQTDPFCLRMLLAKALLSRANNNGPGLFSVLQTQTLRKRENEMIQQDYIHAAVMVKGGANFSYGTSEA